MHPLALVFLALLTSAPVAVAQDRDVLGGQLMQLLLAFPEGFVPLQDPASAPTLALRLTGTVGNALVLSSGEGKKHVTAWLPTPRSAEEAQALFDRWAAALDAVDFNGAKLVPAPCAASESTVHCRRWSLDGGGLELDPKFASFGVSVRILKVGEAYGAGLHVGAL